MKKKNLQYNIIMVTVMVMMIVNIDLNACPIVISNEKSISYKSAWSEFDIRMERYSNGTKKKNVDKIAMDGQTQNWESHQITQYRSSIQKTPKSTL